MCVCVHVCENMYLAFCVYVSVYVCMFMRFYACVWVPVIKLQEAIKPLLNFQDNINLIIC